MPNFHQTYFDEKSGFVPCATPWGRWWQTVSEVHIEVDLPAGTKGSACKVILKTSHLKVIVLNETIMDGNLYSHVILDDLVWTVEDRKKLYITLAKGDVRTKENTWEGLLKDNYLVDPWLLHEMQKKLDLERFQIENPGFDFRGAKISKGNDKVKQSKIWEWEERQNELKKGTFYSGVHGCSQVTEKQTNTAENSQGLDEKSNGTETVSKVTKEQTNTVENSVPDEQTKGVENTAGIDKQTNVSENNQVPHEQKRPELKAEA